LLLAGALIWRNTFGHYFFWVCTWLNRPQSVVSERLFYTGLDRSG
jgi:hypothetical protein